MCNLCSDDMAVAEKERARLSDQADRLRRLAKSLDNLADGYTKPHGNGVSGIKHTALSLIRDLVEDWV